MPTEYKRYGDGFVKRRHEGELWQEVAIDDVPAEEIERIQRIEDRKEKIMTEGYDPDDPPRAFANIRRAGEPPPPGWQEDAD